MFKRAEELMQEYDRKVLIFMGDLVDDWKKQYSMEAYVDTMDTAIDFFRRHPESIYIIGNHDISYLWQQRRNRVFSKCVQPDEKFKELAQVLPENNQPAFIRRLDNCIFCRGGLSNSFVYDLLRTVIFFFVLA